MADDDAADRDPLDVLAEQFLQRRKNGEAVTVAQFAAAHPAHAEGLAELLPTLLALEDFKRDRASTGSGGRVALPTIERLGDFRIVRELGRGGMGVVFEAVQESLGRRVALKVMPQASLLTANQLERFRREAQVAAQLHHSHIVPVYGSGESDGYHWYAMQFIAGESLDRWREQQRRRMPSGSGEWRARARFVARIGAAAASALQCAHEHGTLHRDIKPANLLLDHEQHLWVTDFGLAKALEAEGLTHSGDLLGTLQYMAPEQLHGRYDVRSEVYALGVTLYELLTCQQAFHGKNRSELMERVRQQRREPLQDAGADLPEDLTVVVEKAMAQDPADRYPTAAALQADLEAFVEDRPITARRLTALQTTWRWCRRNRGMAALAAAALLAVVLAAVTGWVAYGVTDDALGRAKGSAESAKRERQRAEDNLRVTLAAFGDVFDALVGSDPTLALDEDPDSDEQTVLVRTALAPRDVELLQQMLAFYEQFAAQNAESQSLRYETARAYRRVGAIHARLGGDAAVLAARQAFDKALGGFAGVTGRDVRRDVAAVRLDLGRLDRRVNRNDDAAAHFEAALQLLGAGAGADHRGVRLDRAEVHFELARTPEPRSARGRRARENLDAALGELEAVLAENGGDASARALKARCLLEVARWVRRRPDADRGPFAARDELIGEAVAILRELVKAHPERPDCAFELCEAILGTRRGPGGLGPGGLGPGGLAPGSGPGAPPGSAGGAGRAAAGRRVTEEDLAALREADALAERLFREQPLFEEYRALYGRTRTALGQGLHLYARRGTGDPASARATVEAALAALEAALAIERPLVPADGPGQPRFLRQLGETLRALVLLHLLEGERDAARARATELLELTEQQLAQAPSGGEPPPEAAGDAPPRLDGPPGRRGERGLLGPLPELLQRLGDADLLQRLEQLRARIPQARPR